MSPTISCPHFSQSRKKLRASPYSFLNALTDILDNVIMSAYTMTVRVQALTDSINNVHTLHYCDDYQHGFKNIKDEGSSNPFNFGHMKDGHNDDAETSEFGTGLKSAAVCLGNIFTVYTRVINGDDPEFYKVVFDFMEMSSREDPSRSYEATSFNLISEDEYREVHPYETGSSIYFGQLSNMVKHVFQTRTFNDKITKLIAETYPDIINNKNISVGVNGNFVQVRPLSDIFDDPRCKEAIITHHVRILVQSGVIVRIIMQRIKHNNDTYHEFDFKSKRLIAIKTRRKYYDILDNANSTLIHTLKFSSTTGYNPETDTYLLGSNMPFNHIKIYRYGRLYDTVNYNIAKDGYANHIAHKVEYDSKFLNKYIGVLFNHSIDARTNTVLTDLLSVLQRDMAGRHHLHKDKIKARWQSETQEPEPTSTTEPEPTSTPEPEPTSTPEPEPTSTPELKYEDKLVQEDNTDGYSSSGSESLVNAQRMVSSFVKGHVLGEDIIYECKSLINELDNDMPYTKEYISLYNLIRKIRTK